MSTWNLHVLTVWDRTCTFFAKTCPGKWSFEVPDLWEEDNTLYAALDSGAECEHT